ncbi:MAG: YceD family protein [Acidiferrobacterales bacterium]
MSSGMPVTVDPVRLADTGAKIAGELPVKAMRRLRALCLDDEGKASVSLRFERSGEQGLRQMFGIVTVQLPVACQRCLERMTVTFTVEPSLIVLKPEERSGDLSDESDVLVADKPLSLAEIVEDELLLAMPMIPMHDVDECPARAYTESVERREPEESPFSVLGKLKHKDP